MKSSQKKQNNHSAGNQKGTPQQTPKDLNTLEKELVHAHAEKMRALADLQNFQRREAANKVSWTELSVAEFLKILLPNLLELKLGTTHSTDKGVQKVTAKLFSELKKQGLTSIEPKKGESIDPHVHEVLMAEEGTPGKVVRTLEPGWKYKSIVLRPAKISGAKHS
jgi:molecular chaperone GrpE